MTVQTSAAPKFPKGQNVMRGEDLEDLWNRGQTSVDSGRTALGTTLATAYAVQSCNTEFTTVAANTGASLPSALTLQANSPFLDINRVLGSEMFVYNDGASTLTVYAPDGSTIDGTAGATGVSLGATKSAAFKAVAVSAAGVVTWRSALNGAVSS